MIEIQTLKHFCEIEAEWELEGCFGFCHLKHVAFKNNKYFLMVLTHFIDFFVTFYSFWRPKCKYITRDGFVLSYGLNLTENSTELVVANSFVWN